jgi:hypothetical protein
VLKTGCVRYALLRSSPAGGRGDRRASSSRSVGSVRASPRCEDREERVDVGRGGRLVERDADRAYRRGAQVDAARRAPRHRARRRSGALDAQRVEEAIVRDHVQPSLREPSARVRRAVDALGDGAEAVRPVIDGVHARHDREQRLRGADVARRLLAADVLLARLQRHAERGLAVRVDADADDAARQLAHELVLAGEERRVRAAVAERHAEALRAADGDVGARARPAASAARGEQDRRHRDQRADRA